MAALNKGFLYLCEEKLLFQASVGLSKGCLNSLMHHMDKNLGTPERLSNVERGKNHLEHHNKVCSLTER